MAATWDAYWRVAVPGGEVRILLGGEDDPATVENCDGFVEMEGDAVRSFTALTPAEVSRILSRWQLTGEEGGGAYLRVPDLVIVRSGGVDAIAAAVHALADEFPPVDIDEG